MKAALGTLLLMLSLGLASVAQAAMQRYAVIDFPATSRGCLAEAANLGRLVGERGGVEVFRSVCRQVWDAYGQDGSYYIEVYYLSDRPVPVVSTSFSGGGTTTGLYRSYQECWADLPAQIEHFQRSTGVAPILHYCSRTYASSSFPIELRIDGIGTTQTAPLSYTERVFGYVTSPVDAVRNTLVANLRELGIDVYGAAVAQETMESRLTIGYYGPDLLDLTMERDLAFPTPALCEAYRPSMERIFAAVDQKPVASFCARKELSSLTEVHVLTLGKGLPLRHEVIRAGYGYEACVAERQRVADAFARQYGGRVLDVVCATDEFMGEYAAHVFATAP